jgi:hypothetical protein
MEQFGSHWTDFHENVYLRIFRKFVEKIQVSLKTDKNTRYFIWRPIYMFLSYLSHFFLYWELFQTYIEKIKTNILCSVTIFKNHVSYEKTKKKPLYSGAGHRWQYDALALHAGNLRLQTHTLSLCSTRCFYTATVIARTRLNVTLHVQCLSFYGFRVSFWCALTELP